MKAGNLKVYLNINNLIIFCWNLIIKIGRLFLKLHNILTDQKIQNLNKMCTTC